MDGIWLPGAIDGEHPFTSGVVTEQRHSLCLVDIQAMLNDGLGVLCPSAAGSGPGGSVLRGERQVDRGLHFKPMLEETVYLLLFSFRPCS